MKRLALLLLLAACNPGPAAPEAKFWTTADFVRLQGVADAGLGGFVADELLVASGEKLLFHEGTQVGAAGLTLFPGLAGGVNTAFVITEIWEDHPEPWVQPVWIPLDEGGQPVPGVVNVFPVDVHSTFYSPYWRAEFLRTRGPLTDATYRSSRDVISASGSGKYERRTGGIIFCPIVPPGTLFADEGSGPVDPVTSRPLRDGLPFENATAWVDGRRVSYLPFGPGRVGADGQDLREAPAYFFVSAAGQRPLPLAALLPSEPEKHSLVRRVDVVLPQPTELNQPAAFVPANRPELRALLEARGLTVPPVPEALDAFPEYALRVATDARCFDDASFPASCTWLDSPERIGRLTQIVTSVQLGIGVVTP